MKRDLHIVLAEDDYRQSERLQKSLLRELPFARVEPISTEQKFRSCRDAFAKDPPDFIVIDVMLRWTDPSPEMESPPEDVKEEGYHRAGFRCIKYLAEKDATRKIPFIVYTVLQRPDLDTEFADLPVGSQVEYLRKDSDHATLISLIRELAQRR